MLDYYLYCQKIYVVARANYMYRIEGNIISRYSLGLDECICYIHDMLDKYNKLGIVCKDYLAFNYTLFTGFILSHSNHKDNHIWFRHRDIILLKKQANTLLSFKVRIKYFFYKFF